MPDLIATFNCGWCELFADGTSLGKKTNQDSVVKFFIPKHAQVIAIIVRRTGRKAFIGSFSNDLVTDESWKCNEGKSPGFNETPWTSPGFNDTNWSHAKGVGGPEKNFKQRVGISQNATWIWTDGDESKVYCRVKLSG